MMRVEPDVTPVRTLITRASEIWQVSAVMILSPQRRQEFCHPRFAVMYAAANELGLSLPRIGRVLGRDHTTVLNGRRRAGEIAERDQLFAGRLAELVTLARSIAQVPA